MAAVNKDLLVRDLHRAAAILRAIGPVLTYADQEAADASCLINAAAELAAVAHDLIDLTLRGIGDPGIGWESYLAKRIDGRASE